MLKVTVLVVGKNKDQWVSAGLEHYQKLLSRYLRLEWKVVDPKTSGSLSPGEIKKREAELLLPHLDNSCVIALSDKGQKFDTAGFAKFIEKTQALSGNRLTFIIGGPYGVDDSILDKAFKSISLSQLTFSHQLVRLVLCEQLYRAFSIISNTSYHK